MTGPPKSVLLHSPTALPSLKALIRLTLIPVHICINTSNMTDDTFSDPQSVKRTMHPPLRIIWGEVNDKNIKLLQCLNTSIFPVNYNDQFYKDLVNALPGFVKLAYFNDLLVAAVCCRKEPYIEHHLQLDYQQEQNQQPQPEGEGHTEAQAPESKQRYQKSKQKAPKKEHHNAATRAATENDAQQSSLYILTLGVLAPYRERGIGTQLLEHVLKFVQTSPHCKNVIDIYLHLQEGNDDALRFYKSHGFEVTEKLPNYYRRIEPADCVVVRKPIDRT